MSERSGACERVVLTGFMGTGKSTVGRLLAELLGWEACDTDELIVERHGEIETIFAQSGEEAFRVLEREVAAELAGRVRLVISTGGRLMLDERSAELLGGGSVGGVGGSSVGGVDGGVGTSRVFCLVADPAEIARRISRPNGGPSRPLLDADNGGGTDTEESVKELLACRAEGYSSFEQVSTDGLSPAEVALDLLDRIRD